MRTIVALLFVASCAIGVECFAPIPALGRRSVSLNSQTLLKPAKASRCLRSKTKASLSDGYNSVLAGVANILLAVDSDGSKTDSLYNGIPATGAVEVGYMTNPYISNITNAN